MPACPLGAITVLSTTLQYPPLESVCEPCVGPSASIEMLLPPVQVLPLMCKSLLVCAVSPYRATRMQLVPAGASIQLFATTELEQRSKPIPGTDAIAVGETTT